MADCGKTEVFLGEWERMCQCLSCENCPLAEIIEGKTCSFWAKRKSEDIIKAIQEWSDSNPAKTHQSMFLDMFPNAIILDGVIDLCPKWIDEKVECNYPQIGCFKCREKYWLTEVK